MINKIIVIFIALTLNLNAFGGKSYNLTIKVVSLSNHQAMEGFKVSTLIKNVKVEVGITDVNGAVFIPSLNEKSMQILVEDPSGKHREETLSYYNPSKVDQVKEIKLRLNRKQEEIFFNERDAKYKDSTGILVNQIPSGKSSNSDKDSIEFIPASPVGGISEFQKFIAMNLEYPQECIEKNIQGKVYISFIIQVDGTITNVVVEKGVSPALDKEASTVIRYSPKWNAAISNGKPVRAKVKTPVNFTLN